MSFLSFWRSIKTATSVLESSFILLFQAQGTSTYFSNNQRISSHIVDDRVYLYTGFDELDQLPPIMNSKHYASCLDLVDHMRTTCVDSPVDWASVRRDVESLKYESFYEFKRALFVSMSIKKDPAVDIMELAEFVIKGTELVLALHASFDPSSSSSVESPYADQTPVSVPATPVKQSRWGSTIKQLVF